MMKSLWATIACVVMTTIMACSVIGSAANRDLPGVTMSSLGFIIWSNWTLKRFFGEKENAES